MFAVDEAVKVAYEAVFMNMGQCCIAASRTFVHEDIYDAFVAKAVALASERKMGDPFDSTVVQGPQVKHP